MAEPSGYFDFGHDDSTPNLGQDEVHSSHDYDAPDPITSRKGPKLLMFRLCVSTKLLLKLPLETLRNVDIVKNCIVVSPQVVLATLEGT